MAVRSVFRASVLCGLLLAAPVVMAAPCLIVSLTGTNGGPQQPFNGLASAGTLVRYGDDTDNCGALKLQFDTGRGTTMRLTQLGVGTEQLNAVFFTHMHNDHTEGLEALVMSRWMIQSRLGKFDVVCSADVVAPQGHTVSCRKYLAHVADAFIESGEVAQRHAEVKERTAGGPADLINAITFEPTKEPQTVWSSGDVKVSAIRSTHMAGNVSYRVDTPAGSVVIGGDATNDTPAPPRSSSTSEQVEKLAQGADIIVHSAVHPVMAPGKGSNMFSYAYYRQSNVPDLGAMAKRAGAKVLVLTHLVPPLGGQQYPFTFPGKPLTEDDYRTAARDGGFTGTIVVGRDLTSVRLPAKK
jgi:ribonuclease Z